MRLDRRALAAHKGEATPQADTDLHRDGKETTPDRLAVRPLRAVTTRHRCVSAKTRKRSKSPIWDGRSGGFGASLGAVHCVKGGSARRMVPCTAAPRQPRCRRAERGGETPVARGVSARRNAQGVAGSGALDSLSPHSRCDARHALGLMPIHARKARVKFAGSSYPSAAPTSRTDIAGRSSRRHASR